MEYWVIESNTRGVLVDWDWASTGNSWGPRFKTSATRPEGMRFYSLAMAQKELEKVTAGGIDDLHGGKTRPIKGCYLTHIDTSGRMVTRRR